MNLVRHNEYHKTEYNRHPIIFNAVKEIIGEPKKIMSFGCSIGCECIALAETFPTAQIFGVEIDDLALSEAKRYHPHESITYTKAPVGDNYDAIFCMNVLCKHPDTYRIDDCSEIYPFENFEFESGNLANRLRVNGVLALFNTNYFFGDTKWAKEFSAIDISTAAEEHVSKFDREGKRTKRSNKEYIFLKTA